MRSPLPLGIWNYTIRENRPLRKAAFLAYITCRAVDFPTGKLKTFKELKTLTGPKY